MIILSHRGYWKKIEEKNQAVAFERSFDLGFGTETDVRDCNGQLVISHDMPVNNEMTLPYFLDIFDNRSLPLAINIKADGLATALKNTMENVGIRDWFVFDMSIPDMRSYLKEGIAIFTRMSEVEKEPVFLEESSGVWLDAFFNTWYSAKHIDTLLQNGKRVCIVSSELHGREYKPLWKMILPLSNHPKLMLCTDHPEQAKEFFGVAQ